VDKEPNEMEAWQRMDAVLNKLNSILENGTEYILIDYLDTVNRLNHLLRVHFQHYNYRTQISGPETVKQMLQDQQNHGGCHAENPR
jgi:hypothetical protein